jgi:capsid protein
VFKWFRRRFTRLGIMEQYIINITKCLHVIGRTHILVDDLREIIRDETSQEFMNFFYEALHNVEKSKEVDVQMTRDMNSMIVGPCRV